MGALVGSAILIHVLVIVFAAFSFDLLGRILLGLDLAFIVILVCATPFIIIKGFIVLTIGAGVRVGYSGRNTELR
jgi:hypothetical protein